ncbi:MAG: Xaa-Pro aminopeptidase family enzyme [Candidatus Aminicenantes bacterium]|nr:Xaa-Pro aminopeptidase family enzyme [Candidatus Aminicenantes bacterium]
MRHLSFRSQAFILLALVIVSGLLTAAAQEIADVKDSKNILPEKDRETLTNAWLKWRLDTIIPELMRREGIDLWLVINREYNEDPVYLSLVPRPTMYARRTSILIFHDRGPEKGVERLAGSYYGMEGWYKGTWVDKKKKQFESLAEVIKAINPKKIGIDTSESWAFGDGLTAALKSKLEKALGPELSSRLVSAENLCVGWLETRSPQEMSVYRHICGIAHDIIDEFFSNRVITPDVTTTDDVVWWIRQRVTDLGLETWFQPSISIQRSKKDAAKYADQGVIRRGDMLHCDVGITYLGLCTDMQLQAYVCRIGETDAPEGLKDALRRANRLADVFMGEFVLGRTGTEIVTAAMKKGEAEGLRPLIYMHPLGIHGHGAGCVADARPPESAPEDNPERGKYPLFLNTAYAIEFSSTSAVPEWDNQDVRIGYEEDALFTEKGCRFIDGRQTRVYLIR